MKAKQRSLGECFVGMLVRNSEGASLVEYALILCLISIVAVAALRLLGARANNYLGNSANQMS